MAGWYNKRLKLTEGAARDFAARKEVFGEVAVRAAQRATSEPAVFRRSLAAIR